MTPPEASFACNSTALICGVERSPGLAATADVPKVFVIGGGELYAQALRATRGGVSDDALAGWERLTRESGYAGKVIILGEPDIAPGMPNTEAIRLGLEFEDGKVKSFIFKADTVRITRPYSADLIAVKVRCMSAPSASFRNSDPRAASIACRQSSGMAGASCPLS